MDTKEREKYIKRINKININKVLKMSDQQDFDLKNKFGMRENIKTTAFIAWFIMALLFIVTLEIEKEGIRYSVLLPLNWSNPWIKLITYMSVTALMLAFALDKGTGAFFKALLAQLYDPRMANAAKVEFLIKQIEKLTGIAVLLNESETLKKNSEIIKKNSETIVKNANKTMDKLTDSTPPPAPPVPPKID